MKLIFDYSSRYYKTGFFCIQCDCKYNMFFTKVRCEKCNKDLPDELIEARDTANNLLCLQYKIGLDKLWG